ncbi:extracellular solute-binding protein [Planomonospora venezuelensis]|uniref:N,N'-diacetylchitobiose transport system substrate-binding protein n=1 Tax=Planomonospora venezuelensis TaxID=1999 RepID=A0A841DDY6_PLAVE|nr:extracellular solute-binding protein [Planomonospora venezuelensis]MBB5967097.1 N,N'-diacetylchitobiose transport system substrate-binding protein [Planomonospora venezuelensis]GIN04937.1 sugar transporter [Planomonospora venezuelensis]
MKHRLLAAAAALALAATAAACGSGSGGGSAAPASTGPARLTVWIMDGSVTDELAKRFETEYEAAHRGVDLDIQIQAWDGIGERVTAALASTDAPDVIEVGNTQVAQYAASGGVKDLTDKVSDLAGSDWIPGLAQPGNIDGRQYGVPWYAANRVVVYNKELFAEAGIEAPPRTRDEWLEITAKLNEGGNQGIYLTGQTWYALAGFIWDEGGDLAVKDGDRWKGALDSPQALAGMDFYKRLQALGKGPKDADEANPPQHEVFAQGKVAQMINVPGGAARVLEVEPGMKGKMGFFPIPGKTADKPGAVFTGGSDLIIPEASKNQDAAYEVVKALAGEKFQTDLAKTMNFVPNRASLAHVLDADEGTAAMARGAAAGRATPNTPNWAAVEATSVIKQYMTAVLTGKDPAAEARKASETITTTLNSGS